MSDAFWNPISMSQPAVMRDWMFESVEDLVDFADLIVLGRISRAHIGEDWLFHPDEPAQPFLYAQITIDEVLKGDPVSREPGSVEFQLTILGLDGQPPHPSSVPGNQALFFLVHEATYRQQVGLPPRSPGIAPYAYFDPAPEAVMRNIDGVVRLVKPDEMSDVYGTDYYPLSLEGSSFAELVVRIREVVVEAE
jgi:hypothetical protein